MWVKLMPNIDIIESIFIKKEALLSCHLDKSTATFEGIMHKPQERKVGMRRLY